MLRSIWQAALDALFPPRCPVCRRYVEEHGAFCRACRLKLVHVRRIPLDRRYVKALDAAYALTDYRAGMDLLIRSLKYRKKFLYLTHINRLLRRYAPPEVTEGFDLAVPVPLYSGKMKSRGFNQTEKIYAAWARESKIVWLDALARRKDTAPQYGLNRRERQRNVAGAFALKEKVDLGGKCILLLDDVFTTGMTMEACAKILRRAGAKRIVGLALSSDA